MRILEQLKLEWADADIQAFRSMWMSRMPIPDIAEQLECSAAEVALLVIDQAEKELIGEWGKELADVIETVNIYGEKIKGRIIKENINTVIIEGTDGRQHVVRNERIGKKIAKRDKKHAQGFNRSQVEGYGQAPDKRAVHHYGRGPRVAGGAG